MIKKKNFFKIKHKKKHFTFFKIRMSHSNKKDETTPEKAPFINSKQ